MISSHKITLRLYFANYGDGFMLAIRLLINEEIKNPWLNLAQIFRPLEAFILQFAVVQRLCSR